MIVVALLIFALPYLIHHKPWLKKLIEIEKSILNKIKFVNIDKVFEFLKILLIVYVVIRIISKYVL